MAKTDLTAARISELVDYNPKTGQFTHKPKPAGHIKDGGYIELCLDAKKVSAHHAAWFLFYGKWPDGIIDHINGNPSDNRIENLRDTNHRVNAENQRRAKKTNQAKMLGVSWHNQNAKWQAEIFTNGKKKYLGLFLTPEEAHAVYLDAKRRLHEGCTI